jgi:two-component system chemotaxis response regulator CheY
MPEYKILIIEDSPTMRQLIAFALKRLPGVRIVEAHDGVDGLKKLSSDKFDLILTDINMPVMDGLKLVSLVRNDANYRTTPIVVITTEGAQEDRDRALALGANDYITKPIQANRILELARSLLKPA